MSGSGELSMLPAAVSAGGALMKTVGSRVEGACAQVYGMACVTVGDPVIDAALAGFQGVFSPLGAQTALATASFGASLVNAAQSTVATDNNVMGGGSLPGDPHGG